MIKLNLRADGRIEWTCKHGVGHTIAIPYHLVTLCIKQNNGVRRKGEQDAHFSHGCDGCCGEGKAK
jgi:hypothetical protein